MVMLLAKDTEAYRYRALGRRVRELRERFGLTQRELGERVHVSESYFGGVEIGRRRPEVDILQRTAAVFGIEYEELAALAGYLPQGEVEPEPPRFLGDVLAQIEALRPYEVPIYEDAPIHAGNAGVPIQIAYLPAMQRRRESIVGFLVRSDCMEPVIHDGDVVIIDLEESPRDGQVVAVETDDGWSLRRYTVRGKEPSFECDKPESPEAEVPVKPESPVYAVIEARRLDLRKPNQ